MEPTVGIWHTASAWNFQALRKAGAEKPQFNKVDTTREWTSSSLHGVRAYKN